jgi:hypothetical protein
VHVVDGQISDFKAYEPRVAPAPSAAAQSDPVRA